MLIYAPGDNQLFTSMINNAMCCVMVVFIIYIAVILCSEFVRDVGLPHERERIDLFSTYQAGLGARWTTSKFHGRRYHAKRDDDK